VFVVVLVSSSHERTHKGHIWHAHREYGPKKLSRWALTPATSGKMPARLQIASLEIRATCPISNTTPQQDATKVLILPSMSLAITHDSNQQKRMATQAVPNSLTSMLTSRDGPLQRQPAFRKQPRQVSYLFPGLHTRSHHGA